MVRRMTMTVTTLIYWRGRLSCIETNLTDTSEASYTAGFDPPNYPVPSPIFLAYDWEDRVSPGCRYWQPN